MSFKKKARQILLSEVSIFIYLWIALFLFTLLFGRNRNQVSITPIQLAFLANSIVMTILNNFVLIPRYLIKGNYMYYLLGAVLTILVFGATEEFLIEPYFLDSSRAHATIRGFEFAVFKSLFIVGLFSSYKLIWDYQQKQQRLKQLERDRVESELKFLKSQISPHVLFNNLNNIYSYALEGSRKTPEMIMKLSELMRYMLYEAHEKWVPLKKEIGYLKDFVELQKIRLEDRGDVRFEVDGDLEHYKIAPLLLVAFVENSFKHGMNVHDDQVYIRIKVKTEGNKLYFYTENSIGPRTDSQQKLETDRGIGLDNVKKRLELLYQDRYQLHFEEDENRFYVTLMIELQ